jgi:class 3 adenylate cyclase
VICPSCGQENPPSARFCNACATPLPARAHGLEEERKVVTVLFADLVGFTTLAEHLDPEELRTLMTETLSELTEEVEQRDGWVEKFIGDAIVAVYGAPVAHENDPERAVETALGMLEIVRRRSEATPTPLELRIGINSGLVVAGAVGDGTQTGVMGDAVNVAARLQQSAGVGEVLVSASNWRRVRVGFESEPAGALDVKGRGQPVEAYRLLGRGASSPRQRVPFVGRREELALLDLLWSSAAKGNAHVVSVVGEPGVGKSRLLEELHPQEIRSTSGSPAAESARSEHSSSSSSEFSAAARRRMWMSFVRGRPSSGSSESTLCSSDPFSASEARHRSSGWPMIREVSRSSTASGSSSSRSAQRVPRSLPSTTSTGRTSPPAICSTSCSSGWPACR